MKSLLFSFALIGALCGSAMPSVRPLPPEDRGRFVLDVGTFRWKKIGSGPGTTWVVGNIKPDKYSGELVVESGYIDGNTGKFVHTGKGKDYIKVSGVLQIISTLAGPRLPNVLPYSWHEPPSRFVSRAYVITRETQLAAQVAAAFTGGATVIAQIDPTQQGRAQFVTLRILPPTWKALAAPAYRLIKSDAALFDAHNVARNAVRLRALLRANNPLVAIAACQTLADAGKLDPSFIGGPLSDARGLRQAIFAFVLVLQGVAKSPYRELGTNSRLAPLADALARRQSIAGLENLRLGLSIAGVGQFSDPFDHKTPLKGFGPSLLRAIARRTRDLKLGKPRNQDERNLLLLAHNAGLS